MHYKIDWLAFSVALKENVYGLDSALLEQIGYNLEDFDVVPGKYFYNSGYTFKNYVNVYWNDPSKKGKRHTGNTMAVVFTGQGCTELAEKLNNDWVGLFSLLNSYEGVKVTRLDIALDDFDEKVRFSDLEAKLNKGHYRSSRRRFNIVKTSDVNGNPLGRTIYIGNPKADTGSRGSVYARIYDKRAQYLEKGELFSDEIEAHWEKTGNPVWNRYEISYSKEYARAIVNKFLAGDKVDKIFKTSLRNLLEILNKKSDKNKARWPKTKWWEDFLAYDEAIDFGIAERDVNLGGLLEWIRVSVLPSLKLLDQLAQDNDLDFYRLLERGADSAVLSKKQERLLVSNSNIGADTLKQYFDDYLGGGE